ncbi:MAG: hypothetical protein SFU85_02700 [Candidatus Methylacidiphilales bacterium]|nr:hypothetical protein [Candidatus Methylacidiphilales bacterium]
MRPNKTTLLALLALSALAAPLLLRAQSEFAIGSIIKSFQLPQRDSDGKMKLQISGEQATVISLNRIKVEKIRIDLYRDGQPEVQMNSPETDFWKQENRLTTNKGVEIRHPSFKLVSQKMDWELNANKGLFQGGVILTVQKKEAAIP